jgi:hypothetical protein
MEDVFAMVICKKKCLLLLALLYVIKYLQIFFSMIAPKGAAALCVRVFFIYF